MKMRKVIIILGWIQEKRLKSIFNKRSFAIQIKKPGETMITSASPDETRIIGFKMGVKAKAGGIYCLTGELGAGKTVFAKGFAEGLSVTCEVTSPTFTIINEYEGRLKLYHIDAYRCAPGDMDDIGLDEYIYGRGVTLIEWAGQIRERLPDGCVWIDIARDDASENIRRINIYTSGV